MKIRLLDTGKHNAAMNMAIDESILESRIPTLRFYKWSPPAISLGYFQGIGQEVDLTSCKKYGIDVVRRMTGGGAVFHDKELTYSLLIDEASKEVSRNILESYRQICGFLVDGLQNLGLDAEFKPINDITVNGKKISGNAQTRRDGMILQHGTILLDVDVEKMFLLLKVPDEKIKDKLISAVQNRVTSTKQELGRNVGFDEIKKLLIDAFNQESHMRDLEQGTLSEDEIVRAEELCKNKYLTKRWNFMR